MSKPECFESSKQNCDGPEAGNALVLSLEAITGHAQVKTGTQETPQATPEHTIAAPSSLPKVVLYGREDPNPPPTTLSGDKRTR